MRVDWQGVFPALMTEFTQDGALDLASTQRHARACLDAGCDGLIMLGTLGENSSLSPEEKETVLRAAVEAAEGRVPVIAGVAEYTTELGIAQARRSERAGCAGLMALPCMVYEQDEREAVHHFRTLAAGTGLPIMIYNNPLAYKVDLKPEGFLGLVESGEHRGDQGILARQPAHDRQLERAGRPLPDVLRRRRPDLREHAVRGRRAGSRAWSTASRPRACACSS